MVVGSPELVVARCQDLSQELINRDLHLVVGDVVLSYHQAMVVPHSPFLLALLGRVNERVQTVYLEGVTAAAVVALMEFIYTGACIVTAHFASEVQQVQSLLQFQVEIESFILAPADQFPEMTPAAVEETMSEEVKLPMGKKRQIREYAAAKPPKKLRMRKDGTKVRGKSSLKIKKEKVESTEHATELENEYEETNEESRKPEEVVKTIESQSDQASPQNAEDSGTVLPQEGSKEYKALYKKVRDRLWKRRIREGVIKPFISKEEVEREMMLFPREAKSPKSGTVNAEVNSPNTDAGAFPPPEGTLSPRAILAKYESVFPQRTSPSVKSEFQPNFPIPKPSIPPLPLMLPMPAFKTELLSPVAQLASKVSKSVAPTPFEPMMPGPAFLARTLQTNSLKPEFLYPPTPNNLNLDQHLSSQDRLFQNQRLDFPQLTDPNFVYLDPPSSDSSMAQNRSFNTEDVVNNLSSNNFNSNNMEDVSDIADLWSCLPYTEEGFSFELQYDNMV